MLKKIIIMLFVFLYVSSISEARRIILPPLDRSVTDFPLQIVTLRCKESNDIQHKKVLLLTSQNWNHFVQLFTDYQSDPENWTSSFTDPDCTEIIIFTTMIDIARMKLNTDHIAFLPKLLPTLTSLSLREHCAQNDLIMAIAQIQTLEEIDLYQNHATKEGIKALALLPNLISLNLGFNNIHHTDYVFEEIVKTNKHIETLEKEVLNIMQNQETLTNIEKDYLLKIQDEIKWTKQSAVEALATNPSLQELNLAGTQLTEEDLKIIATMNHLNLLNLTANYLRNQGVKIIASMHNLKDLNICGNKITDDGIGALYKMNNLRKLNVSRNQFSNIGENTLSQMHWLEKLNIAENTFVTNDFTHIRRMPATIIIGLNEQED